MRFYFVRHGESSANLTQTFSNQFHEKHPLTDKGRAQAQALAEKLRDISFAEIFVSPMLRARETAEIINASRSMTLTITPAIIEHNAGDLEGRSDPAAWADYNTLFEKWIVARDLNARMPNGESFNDMRARFIPFLSDLAQKYADTDANILLVGHAGIFHSMLPLVLSNVGYAFGSQHILSNTAVVIAEQQDGALVCLEWDSVKLSPTGTILDEI